MYPIPKGKNSYPNYQSNTKTVNVSADPFQQLNSFLSSWTVGFDRHFQLLEELRNANKSTYPPYNIIQVDDEETYLIEIAAAGFTKSDIEITSQDNSLVVTGKKDLDSADYVHKGIAARDFEQKFALADDVRVISASMKDGILTIRLEREIPEHKKPRTIQIK
jgi:molecular chaperone IbpA